MADALHEHEHRAPGEGCHALEVRVGWLVLCRELARRIAHDHHVAVLSEEGVHPLVVVDAPVHQSHVVGDTVLRIEVG